ncbi:hypothetical protein O181_124676 [Austropuccinia psidii MF-1]|uniref:Integrase zinc-binding domain-containing protein n=1 Tax=Austropuccinia psidii MF-1 TaxID=1389203 RepID=A0A9Q3Q4C8_9BASI|nr:hypothetical protein [Austropuccinia psidii MF-1]
MVFSKSEEEYVTHVSTVPSRLRANKLFAKASTPQDEPSKSSEDSQLASSKKPQSSAIIPWLCQFLLPFHQELFKEDQFNHQFHQERFLFPPQSGSSQSVLPLLQSFSTHHCRDRCIRLCLGCCTESGKHPIAFNSYKLNLAELSYEIHDKELLGIVWALKHWRAFLLSLSSPFEVLTNHSSLQYFMSSKVLTGPTIQDALSHWDNGYPERGEDFISNNPMNFQQLIKQDEVEPSIYFAVKVESFSNLIESIQKQLWQDPQYRNILQELGKSKSVQDYSLDSSSQPLLFKDRVVVPNDPTIQLRILQKRHDSPLAGHPGQGKTLKLVKQDFHWSGMTQFIKDYVSSC